MLAIIDYGVGNLFSLQCSLKKIGVDAVVTNDAQVIRDADRIILPGVGAFGDAINKLRSTGLVDTINKFADVSEWRCQYDTSLHHKSLRKIGYERNKITHGEEFSQSLTDIILNTSNYIALYIYTVARFWNE